MVFVISTSLSFFLLRVFTVCSMCNSEDYLSTSKVQSLSWDYYHVTKDLVLVRS